MKGLSIIVILMTAIWSGMAVCTEKSGTRATRVVYKCESAGCGGDTSRGWVKWANCTTYCCEEGGWAYLPSTCGSWSNVGTCCDVNSAICMPNACGNGPNCPYAIDA
jgi:hypothetical protein